MLFVSILQSDRERDPELWATLWQGSAPSGLKFLAVYNLQNDIRVFVVEADSDRDISWLDRLNSIGQLTTTPAFDRTRGWQQALARDIEGFSRVMVERYGAEGKKQADLRRRAMETPNAFAARRVARDWVAEREEEG
jgi:hypothetical protein